MGVSRKIFSFTRHITKNIFNLMLGKIVACEAVPYHKIKICKYLCYH